MAFIVIRCIVLYFAVILAVRIMGKRQIGELQPSELVITILISELASMPMQDTDLPILYAVLPIFTLAALEIAVSLVTLKSVGARYFFYGKPIVMVKNGSILQSEMERARVSVDDLTEAMRSNGISRPEDIDCAILETNGNVSVISKSADSEYSGGMPYIVISDGRVISENLRGGIDSSALELILKRHGIKNVQDVFLMTYDGDGNTFIVKKERKIQ